MVPRGRHIRVRGQGDHEVRSVIRVIERHGELAAPHCDGRAARACAPGNGARGAARAGGSSACGPSRRATTAGRATAAGHRAPGAACLAALVRACRSRVWAHPAGLRGSACARVHCGLAARSAVAALAGGARSARSASVSAASDVRGAVAEQRGVVHAAAHRGEARCSDRRCSTTSYTSKNHGLFLVPARATACAGLKLESSNSTSISSATHSFACLPALARSPSRRGSAYSTFVSSLFYGGVWSRTAPSALYLQTATNVRRCRRVGRRRRPRGDDELAADASRDDAFARFRKRR